MIKKKQSIDISFGSEKIEIKNLRYEKPYHPYDVKCDRSSPLGNPVGLQGDESKRDWACNYYTSWFKREVLTGKNKQAFDELMRIKRIFREHGKLKIFCWCAPKRCHTETIKQWLLEN